MKLRAVFLLFFAIVFLTLLGSQYYAHTSYRTMLLKYVADCTDSTIAQVTDYITAELEGDTPSNIQKILDKTNATHPFIKSLSFSTDQKTIDYSSDRTLRGRNAPSDYVVLNGQIGKTLESGRLEVCFDIRHFRHENQLYGKLYLAIDRNYLFGQINDKALEITKKLVFVQAIFFVLFAIIFSRIIVTPLYEVFQLAVSREGRQHSFWIKDIGILYSTLLESFANLGLQKEQLLELNRSLEARVEQETQKRINAEHVLFEQSKLALMGETMSMVAHQWRQPLNSLGLAVQDIKEAYSYGELNKEYIDNVVATSMRQIQFMSKTIDDFRNFFSPGKAKTLFCIEDAVESILSIVSAQLKNDEIEVFFSSDGRHTINSFEGEFQQVILSLVSNAKDAILENAPMQKYISINIESRDKAVVVTVEDSGGGISDEIMPRVFDPYFSTKEQGKGLGIGLYMSKQIIDRHMCGRLSVENGQKGARFTIELPVE